MKTFHFIGLTMGVAGAIRLMTLAAHKGSGGYFVLGLILFAVIGFFAYMQAQGMR